MKPAQIRRSNAKNSQTHSEARALAFAFPANQVKSRALPELPAGGRFRAPSGGATDPLAYPVFANAFNAKQIPYTSLNMSSATQTASRLEPALGRPGAPQSYLEQLRHELQPGRVLRLGVITIQFALVVAAIRLLNIETKAFELVLTLALGGFLVHHFLPAAWRQGFFAALSVASVPMIFGWHDGAWILGAGGLLIALCHLPVPMRWRIALLVVVGGILAAERMQALPTGSPIMPTSIWPILGSMFMFRILIYIYDLKHRAAAFSIDRTLTYFFMLPNVCFPLYPIVDYKTLQRSAYNDDALRLYQTGNRFMLRGLTHLALYMVVYHMGVIDAVDVATGMDAAQYMFVAYLLYLKISGTFHLIIGILHMYGFGLPATHHLYLLTSSFTDLWRRANIYWKEFIQKLVFNPTYFKLRKRGETLAVCSATAITAVLTWLLHSYQWFWIRGTFPFGWSDIVFWGALGIGLTVNTTMESRNATKRRLEKRGRTFREGAILCLKTAGMFTTIIVLWTIWNTPKVEELGIVWRGVLSSGPAELAVLLGVPLGLGVLRVLFDDHKRDGGPGSGPQSFWREATFICVGALAFIAVALRPIWLAPVSPRLATLVSDVREGRLNDADKKRLIRGYYENLADGTRFNDELSKMFNGRPRDWSESPQTRERADAIGTEFVPSTSMVFKGALRTINSLGMRDREYAQARGPDTFRIALVGVSNDAGSGVRDDETYENVVEDRLNRELGPLTGKKFEVLNFSIPGSSATQKLAMFEKRVFDFHPDVVLYIAYSKELDWVFESVPHLIKNRLVGEFPFVERAIGRAGIVIESGQRPPEKIVLASKLAPYASDALHAVLERFRDGARARGIRPALVLNESLDDGPARSDKLGLVAQIGRSLELPVLDLNGSFAGVKDPRSLWIAPWDTHPNAEGHRLLAERLYTLLLKEGLVQAAAPPATGAAPGK